MALRTHPKEQKGIYIFFEWKGYMVKKNRRNNIFLKEKIKHEDTRVN